MLTEPQRTAGPDDVADGVSGDGSWARQIEMVVQSLQVRLGVSINLALIRSEVESEFATFEATRVRDFVPILVEARVHERLCRRSAP